MKKEKYAKELLEIACNGKSVAVCGEKMKNKEKYAKELLEIACDGKSVAVCVETEKPVACEEMSCGRCLFFVNEICEKEKNVRAWAESEYIEKPVITKRDRAFLAKAFRDIQDGIFELTELKRNDYIGRISDEDLPEVAKHMEAMMKIMKKYKGN